MQGLDQIGQAIDAIIGFFDSAYEKGWLMYLLIGLIIFALWLFIR